MMLADGIYVSAYLTPPGPASLLGWWFRHDNNLSVWEKTADTVTVIAAYELERFSRTKHDGEAFGSVEEQEAFVDQCLAESGVGRRDVRQRWGQPGDHHVRMSDVGPLHAWSHVFSGLVHHFDAPDQVPTVALSIDGRPDAMLETRSPREYFVGAGVSGDRVVGVAVQSPALLYTWLKRTTGLEEGSLMALGSAARARLAGHDEIVRSWVTALDGRLYGNGASRASRAAVDGIVRQAATADLELLSDGALGPDELRLSAIVKVIDEIADSFVDRAIDRVISASDVEPTTSRLAIAGGFGLNCPANERARRRWGFRDFLSTPFPNDAGQSVGMALHQFAFHIGPSRLRLHGFSPYQGATATGLSEVLDRFEPWIEDVSECALPELVDDLCQQPVAWVCGREEAGPRALGARSLLTDPRRPSAKDELNRIKQRQWWRPVAPAVLEEHAGEWFVDGCASRYMTRTFDATAQCLRIAPSIVHLDGSARIQTVPAGSGEFRTLLEEFYRVTGLPILANTSLNDRGEPIVSTASEAALFCLKRGVRRLWIDGRRIRLRAARPDEALPVVVPRLRRELRSVEELARSVNPHDASVEALYAHMDIPELRTKLTLGRRDDALALEKYASMLTKSHPDWRAEVEWRRRRA